MVSSRIYALKLKLHVYGIIGNPTRGVVLKVGSAPERGLLSSTNYAVWCKVRGCSPENATNV